MDQRRLRLVGTVFVLACLLLLARLSFVSLIKGDELLAKAASQESRSIAYHQYGRGDFLDRCGRLMTGGEEASLVVFPGMAADEDELYRILREDFGLERRVCGDLAAGQARILKSGLNASELARQDSLPSGLFILPLAPRYGSDALAAHLIGSVALGEDGDYHGSAGLEAVYDDYLSGRRSSLLKVLVDERGHKIEDQDFFIVDQERENEAKNIRLTLDRDFQTVTERALGGSQGAAVVMDVTNGQILAMASSPSFDQYYKEEAVTKDVYVNKALGLYPPASVFKILLTVAALEEGLTIDEAFTCNGCYELSADGKVHCWLRSGHGKEGLKEAVGNSCNPYFIDLALRLGGDKIKKYAALLGLSQQRIVGYPLKASDVLDFNTAVDADIANVAIGEKGVSLSPVMVAQLLSVVANGGKLVYPQVVLDVEDLEGNVLSRQAAPMPLSVINEATAATVRDLLTYAASEGTGKKSRAAIVSVGGKTGTTQDRGVWFAGFAPAQEPKWAVAVYLTEGSAGGAEGAAVFVQIIDGLAVLSGLN